MAGKYIWSGLGETQNILNQNPKKITLEDTDGELYTLFSVRDYNEDSITEYYYVEAEVPYTQCRIMTHSGFSIPQADVELQLLFKQIISLKAKGNLAVQAFTTGEIGELIHQRYGWLNPRKKGKKITVSVNGQDIEL